MISSRIGMACVRFPIPFYICETCDMSFAFTSELTLFVNIICSSHRLHLTPLTFMRFGRCWTLREEKIR